jgi:phosphate transport system permease protein
MNRQTRGILDFSFSALGVVAISLMALALVVILTPIVGRGIGAYVFRGTIEFREVMFDEFGDGDPAALKEDRRAAEEARRPVTDAVAAYQRELDERGRELMEFARALPARYPQEERGLTRRLGKMDRANTLTERLDVVLEMTERARRGLEDDRAAAALDGAEERVQVLRNCVEPFAEFKEALREVIGPLPGDPEQILVRKRYGQTRWKRARVKLHDFLYEQEWVYPEGQMGHARDVPRADRFRGTPLDPVFSYMKENLRAIMRPRWTFYGGFLTDTSLDAHFFGGIWPEVLGTFYLTIGAMLFAVPIGIIAAIYLCEYARPTRVIGLLRTCISTLAGVPSIVFGLFGLAFFLHSIQISDSKSVLAGSLTLALMILPTVIRASEEAILAVPSAYKEAALGLGAGRWRTIVTVVLPAALPGILTGIVISMGRAAGETAPIIFTAAVSVGRPLSPLETLSQPTPALPWNIYNIATEHEAVDEIRHVQYGMVFTLVALVLLLNVAAIAMRARISKKLRG